MTPATSAANAPRNGVVHRELVAREAREPTVHVAIETVDDALYPTQCYDRRNAIVRQVRQVALHSWTYAFTSAPTRSGRSPNVP